MGKIAVSYLYRSLAVVLGGALIAISVLCYRAAFVSPSDGGVWMSMALALPVILVVDLVFGVWWFCRRRWIVALLPLIGLAINYEYIGAMVRLPRFGEQVSAPRDLRLATLNVNGFRTLGPRTITARALDQLSLHEGVDVLCLQEYMQSAEFTTAEMKQLFASHLPYVVAKGGQAILSRYPILRSQHVRFENTGNDLLWADLLIKEDTVRIFSVHLQTSGIASLRHRFRKYYDSEAPVDRTLSELRANSARRAGQVNHLCRLVDECPYPLIVAGDINDTPSTYTYRALASRLTDGFRESGHGFGSTFRSMGGLLRIDYVFYNQNIESVDYGTSSAVLSDHWMLLSDLRIKR